MQNNDRQSCETCHHDDPNKGEFMRCKKPGPCIRIAAGGFSGWTPKEPTGGLPISESEVKPDRQPGDKYKHDTGKTKWHLIPWRILEDIAKVMTCGAAKYTEDGWKKVPGAKDRYFSAMMRHWRKMEKGEYIDPDFGLPHWAHFCCNAIFLGYFALTERLDTPKDPDKYQDAGN